MKKIDIQSAVISAGIALLTGFLSSFFSGNQSMVYQTINLPPYSPPAWLFGVVWPLLYVLMGIAASIVYTSPAPQEAKRNALFVYALQLLVNFSWSIVFFRLQNYGGALVVLALLLFLVTLTIMFFYDIDKWASRLLIPYLIWLLFAYYLNAGVFVLNLK